MASVRRILIIFVVTFLLTACVSQVELPIDRFEAESVSLSTLPHEKIELYEEKYLPENLFVIENDTSLLEEWNQILQHKCITHYPNHPGYEETMVATSIVGDQDLKYTLRFSNDRQEIDLYPIIIEKVGERTVIRELGIYRCEGLPNLVNQMLKGKK